MPSQIIQECARELSARNLSIAFAESATAGCLACEFALTEQSGKILKGGIVCYDANLKVQIVGVDQSLIERFSPESMQVTQSLATHLANLIESDVQVGVTGLTTPGGSESEQKPVGTIFICARIKGKLISAKDVFKGSPEQIMLAAADLAAETILKGLDEISP